MRRSLPHAVVALALVGSVLAAFWPALGNGFVNWDDNILLVNNARFRGLSPAHLEWMATTFLMGHWEPLTWVSWALDHAVWGLDPRGYHLTNVLLHAAHSLAVYALFRALLARRTGAVEEAPADRWAALAGALLFALHPLRVESVAWATERRDVLSGLFLTLGVIAWLRAKDDESSLGRWTWVALGLYALSLGSKAWGITLPAVLLVLDGWPLRRFGRVPLARLVVEKLPFVALAAGAAVLAFVAQRSSGAMEVAAEHGVLQRAAQASFGLVFYPYKLVAPFDLSPLYLIDLELDPFAANYLACFGAVLATTVALVVARRRWPAGLAAWIAYAALVSPVLGLTQSGIQMAADRYSYLACIPLLALVVGGLARVPRALPLALAVAASLGVLTWQQTHVWRDSGTLWARAMEHDGDNWFALTNLGAWEQEAGRDREALTHYDRAIDLNPRYHVAWTNRAQARFALGDRAGARSDLDHVLTLHPGFAKAWNDRGLVRAEADDLAGALGDFDEALRLSPAMYQAVGNRGAAKLRGGDPAGAEADLRRSVELNPISADFMYNLAAALLLLGRTAEAAEQLERALGAAAPGWPQEERARATIEQIRNEDE